MKAIHFFLFASLIILSAITPYAEINKVSKSLIRFPEKFEKENTSVFSNAYALYPGDIAPDAVYIDADGFNAFNGGAAVVSKGKATALIDAKGNFLVPYNKYTFSMGGGAVISGRNVRDTAGLFIGKGSYEHDVLIDAKGKILYEGNLLGMFLSDRGKYACADNRCKEIVSADGKKYSFSLKTAQIVQSLNDATAIVYDNTTNKYEYIALNGKPITNQSFDEINPFSDGLGLVGKKNEFGEMKYGYINKQGAIAIPLQYSIKPSDFVYGFARVTPKEKNEFNYAFINKKGEIAIKVTRDMVASIGTNQYFSQDGFIYSARMNAMDTTGKMISYEEFLSKNSIADIGIKNISFDTKRENCGHYIFLGGVKKDGSGTKYGFINLQEKTFVECNFENQLYFDPVSNLSYAKLLLKREAGFITYREGYINSKGVFVIVKKEGSQF